LIDGLQLQALDCSKGETMNKKTSKFAVYGAVVLTLCALAWWGLYMDKWLITRHIRDWANDPDSVVLRDLRQSKRDKEVWCGELNARNRMGGMAGFQRFVFTQPGFGSLRYDAELMRILSSMKLEDSDGFTGRYQLFCQ
jgi:hypothetical protein